MKTGGFLIYVAYVILLLNGCSGTSDEVLTGTRSYACVYNPGGKTPAAGATVKIFRYDAVNGEYISIQSTDTEGRYSLGNIPYGIYNVWAQKDSMVAFRSSLEISADNEGAAASDTLGCQSTLSGTIGVEPQDDPLTVTIQVLGLDKYFNNTGKSGCFTLKGMAEGNYTLFLKSTEPHYTPTAVDVYIGRCTNDTISDTLHLTYTGIPVVTGLEASCDTMNGTVLLHWNSSEYRNFQEYLIYRSFFDSASYSPDPISAVTDTFFSDTIFRNFRKTAQSADCDTASRHFRYRVAIRSTVNEIGKTYRYADILAVSPEKVITASDISTYHMQKGYLTKLSDTFMPDSEASPESIASVNDTVQFIINAKNKTRPLALISWTDESGRVLRTKTIDEGTLNIYDTLPLVWQTTGIRLLYITIIDRAGFTVKDTAVFNISEDFPAVRLVCKDSIRQGNGKNTGLLQYAFGDTVHLHASVKDCFGSAVNLKWTFGTQTPFSTGSDLQDVSAILPDSTAASYPLSIAVTDDDGNTASDTLFVNLNLFAPVTRNASFSPRLYQAGLVFLDRMWLYGGVGTTGESPKTSFRSLDDAWSSADGYNWTEEASDIPARSGQAMTVFNGRLYLIGGYANSWGEYKNDIWTSENGIKWICICDSAKFSARIFHTVTVHDNKMWLTGGLTRKSKMNDVWNSSDGINWSLVTDSAQFSPRSSHAAVCFDGKMWIIAGEDTAYNPLNDIWYSVNGSEWTEAVGNAEFSPRQGHSLLVYNNEMWLIEGYGINSFDMAEDMWHSKNGLQWVRTSDSEGITPRAFHSSMVFRNRIWIAAGMTGYDACVNDVWRSGNIE